MPLIKLVWRIRQLRRIKIRSLGCDLHAKEDSPQLLEEELRVNEKSPRKSETSPNANPEKTVRKIRGISACHRRCTK